MGRELWSCGRSCTPPSRVYSALEASLRGYEELVEPLLGYPRHKEACSSQRIVTLLGISCETICRTLHDISEWVEGRACVVTPAGMPLHECDILIVADSASKFVITRREPILAVVTDLDGGFQTLRRVAQVAKFVVVHAHGDNHGLLSFAGELRDEAVIASSQIIAPRGTPLLAPFGFTDADRGVLLAFTMGFQEVLVPWNPRPVSKRWSDATSKYLKMRIALELIEFYARYMGYRCSSMKYEALPLLV